MPQCEAQPSRWTRCKRRGGLSRRLRRVITELISAPPLAMTQEQALCDQLSVRWIDALYRCVLSEESIGELTFS